MRSGGCTVQQALTSEAASVLKLSLSLARRRGHAQVTPLHVASTLLTSSSTLLRRACLKSHHHLSSHPHPLQCRALELCFNVALNRLPTISSSSSSSSSLIHTNPSLSNALIAALKRAQAHQRRGCVEQQQQQQQHFHQNQNQIQQQPLLAIKVELEQLIISILDDPSVSRVMREAGFSSTTVKSNIEEDTSVISPSSLFFDSPPSFWNSTHLLKPHKEEDLRVIMEVMLSKQQRRTNAVIVGDSVSSAEEVVAEFMGRVERGEVPDELKSSHFIKLQLSYVHLRLMSRTEVDMKVTDLRRRVSSLVASERLIRGGVIIHVGDLRWALDDEERRHGGFSAVEHLIEQVGILISEMKNKTASRCKVWLMATASYQTYMRCQVRHTSLESQWNLQPVMVPSGGLRLSLQAPPSFLGPRVTKMTQYPFQMLEPKVFNPKEEEEEEKEEEEEEDKLLCCAECTSEFDKEALVFKSQGKYTNTSQLPYWLQPYKPNNHNYKDHLLELRKKWNKLCKSRHFRYTNHFQPPYPSTNSWWSTCLTDASTTLALGRGSMMNLRELENRLKENIPWQSETIPSIVEALLHCESSEKGTWLLLQGTDRIGKRRLARVVAECLCGSIDKLFYVESRSSKGIKKLKETLRKEPKCVIFVEDIDRAIPELTKLLAQKDPFGKEVDLSRGIFVLTTSTSNKLDDIYNHDPNRVLKMRMSVEEMSDSNLKRKDQEPDEEKRSKKKRTGESEIELDLNISAEQSDLTNEMVDSEDEVHCLSERLVKSIGVHITMDVEPGWPDQMAEDLVSRLSSVVFDGKLSVDRMAIGGIIAAMGWFLESEFERWIREVFELSVVNVGNGGKVRLAVDGGEGNVGESGFMGSVLPKKVHVD